MKLPGFLQKFTAKKEKKIDYFLSLLFTEERVKAAIWKKENNSGEIVAKGEKEINDNWELITKEVDKLISEISLNIPQNNLNKVIFGLPAPWVDANKIKEEYLSPLKKLANDLSLIPIGFIVTDEAIINYLSKIEGAPATTILLGFRKKKFFITISRIGKIEGTIEKEIKEGVALCEEIAVSLKEDFKQVEVLPSKILLYNGAESLEPVQQELISYPWLTKAEFLHFPKIEILEKDFDLKSLVYSTASEMEIESKTVVIEEADKFGFVEDQDIAGNLAESAPNLPVFKFKLPKLPKINLNLAFLKNIKSRGLIFLGIGLLLLTGLVMAYWFLPKAKITLFITPKNQEKEEEIIVDPNIKTALIDKKTIPGYSISVEEKGSKKINTTGKKIIGEKAKGEVTIFNKTNYPKTFKSGTTIASDNNFKFTLNDDVTIASQSSSDTGITFGKNKVKIISLNIGTDRNLTANNNFKIEDFATDTYSAKNEAAFSGGTSREISVVSEDDQANLLNSLVKELTNKGKSDLTDKISADKSLIDKTTGTSVISKKFSAEVDDEANDLSLDLNLKISSLYYTNSDLTLIINKLVEKSITKDYSYDPKGTTKEVKEAKVKVDKSIVLRMFFKISLLPKINISQLKKDLAGKNIKIANNYLDNLPNVADYEVNLNPKLPGFLYNIPHVINNISIVITRK